MKAAYLAEIDALAQSDSATVEDIERLIEVADNIVTCAEYAAAETPIDSVYFDRLMNNLISEEAYLAENGETGISDEAIDLLSSEIEAFGALGSEVYEYQKKMFGNAFYETTDEQKGQTLYERLGDAVARAEAYLATKGEAASEYVMLNELIGYVSESDAYGMSAEKCEYIVNDINFALDNLAKIEEGTLDTTLDTVNSGELWLDDKGSKISAHGGMILTGTDGKYYWYGEDNKLGYSLTTGLSCYSSEDLKDWTYEGIVLSVRDNTTEQGRLFADDFLTDSIIGSYGRLERPKVIYNESTGKYVMWAHMENTDNYTLSAAGVAVADSPTEPFEWQWYGFPVWDTTVNQTVSRGNMKQTYRDCTLFVDTDGTAYTIYSSESNDTTYAVRLNDEYTWIDTGDDVLATDIEYTDGLFTDGTYNYVDTSDEENIASGKHNYELPSFTAKQLYYTESNVGPGGEFDENTNAYVGGAYAAGSIVNQNGKWSRIIARVTSQAREAPAMIYTGDNPESEYNYQLITSGTSGWNSNPCQVYTGDSVLGESTYGGDWLTSNQTDVETEMSGSRGETYGSQSTYILKLPETANYDYVYMGDRWGGNGDYFGEPLDVKASNYVWLPLEFGPTPSGHGEEGVFYASWADSWDIGEADLSPAASEAVAVRFEKVNEGDNTLYNIVIESTDHKNINRLSSADLTFSLDNKEIRYEILPHENVSVTVDPNNSDRYMFNFSGREQWEETGESIIIGQVKFTGYGAINFRIVGDTNEAHAASDKDNIVTDFIVGGSQTGDATKGDLDISDVISETLAEPKFNLGVNVKFNNTITDNDYAYQQMQARITGGNLTEAIEVRFGADGVEGVTPLNENGSYAFDLELLAYRTYTVEISGVGYRTTRYTVTLNADKNLNFWNNALDDENAMVIETTTSGDEVGTAVVKNYLAGDIIMNNVIDIYDLSAVVAYFGEVDLVEDNKTKYAKYDLNRDGVIDSRDVAIVLVSWGE